MSFNLNGNQVQLFNIVQIFCHKFGEMAYFLPNISRNNTFRDGVSSSYEQYVAYNPTFGRSFGDYYPDATTGRGLTKAQRDANYASGVRAFNPTATDDTTNMPPNSHDDLLKVRTSFGYDPANPGDLDTNDQKMFLCEFTQHELQRLRNPALTYSIYQEKIGKVVESFSSYLSEMFRNTASKWIFNVAGSANTPLTKDDIKGVLADIFSNFQKRNISKSGMNLFLDCLDYTSIQDLLFAPVDSTSSGQIQRTGELREKLYDLNIYSVPHVPTHENGQITGTFSISLLSNTGTNFTRSRTEAGPGGFIAIEDFNITQLAINVNSTTAGVIQLLEGDQMSIMNQDGYLDYYVVAQDIDITHNVGDNEALILVRPFLQNYYEVGSEITLIRNATNPRHRKNLMFSPDAFAMLSAIDGASLEQFSKVPSFQFNNSSGGMRVLDEKLRAFVTESAQGNAGPEHGRSLLDIYRSEGTGRSAIQEFYQGALTRNSMGIQNKQLVFTEPVTGLAFRVEFLPDEINRRMRIRFSTIAKVIPQEIRKSCAVLSAI